MRFALPRTSRAALVLAALALAACGSDGPTQPPDPPPTPTPPAQTPQQWLKANAHPIATLSITSDFRDLEPLRAAIGGARVVMLGEQSHGDGTTFLAKARLIAFLHQQMGFDVLAWESGIYDVHGVWRHIQAGENVLQASRRGIFGIWTRSEQVLPTLDYVASTVGTARPLEMAGFDNQLTGSLARDSVAAHIHAFARRIGSRAADDAEWPAVAATLTELAVTAHYQVKPSAADQERVLRVMAALRADAAAYAPASRDVLFWRQALASIESFARMMWAAPAGQSRPQDNNPRDAQMGANLVWLANVYYPGRKIIVWAASSHIARDTEILASPTGGRPYATGWTVHMGAEAYRVLGPDMYAIGFTAGAGRSGLPGGFAGQLPAMMPGSLEELFARTGHEYAFVDFRNRPAGGDWLKNAFTRPFGYQDLGGDWTRVLDGMIYTGEMVPSTPASR
jgi:erythromycin esterase